MGGSEGGEQTGLSGVLGNRMEFLSKDPEICSHLIERLQPEDANPFEIAQTIAIPRFKFDLKKDSKTSFKKKIKELLGGSADVEYEAADQGLVDRNRDTGGNRNAFFNWWLARDTPELRRAIRDALLAVLEPGSPIKVRWDGDLNDPNGTEVTADLSTPPPDLIFHTHPGVIEPPGLPARPPRD